LKILIIGNISSGKSSLAKLLLQNLSQFNYVAIDDLRTKHGDGSFHREYKAWSEFLKHCENQEQTILEFSGGGCHKTSIKEAISRFGKSLVIYSWCSVNKCLERSKSRKFDTPYPWSVGPVDVIDQINQELENDWKSYYWDFTDNFKVDNSRNFDQIPLQEILLKIHEVKQS
jgi:shikimate kinase